MTKRICNWCARVSEEPLPTSWLRAVLRVEGLDDGSISWLPERSLDFCSEADCVEQIGRVRAFVGDLPNAESPSGGIVIRLGISDESLGSSHDFFRCTRRVVHPGADEDVRALARFFHETSHPKLRRKLEAFEPEEEGGRGSPPLSTRKSPGSPGSGFPDPRPPSAATEAGAASIADASSAARTA